MGSKSSSSSSATTTTNTKTNNLNLQGVQGTQVFTEGTVNVTDGGAIAGSLQIGHDAVSAVTAISQAFLNANKEVNDRAIGLTESIAAGLDGYAGKVTELAATAATDDTAETIQTLVKWGAGATAAVFIIQKMKW